MAEYWEIRDIKEATKCIQGGVKEVNYAGVVREALAFSMKGSKTQGDLSSKLFEGLLKNKNLSYHVVMDALEELGPRLGET